jgi:polar amino acid transport system substrate-binding protein
MKTMFVTLAALAFGTAALAEPVKIGIAAEPYPPFTVPDASGNWSGWEVDIIKAVCTAAEMDCTINPVAWDGIIPSLTSGQIDAIMSSMSITEERMQAIDFSDKYMNVPPMIVAPQGSEFTPDADGLKGKILGVQVSTTHQAYAQKHFADAAAQIKLYQTQDEANQDLVSGRIDATQADSLAQEAFLDSEAGKACCVAMGNVPADEAVLGKGVGAGLRKGDAALKDKINGAIAQIIADGTYDEITARYFKSSIYGG